MTRRPELTRPPVRPTEPRARPEPDVEQFRQDVRRAEGAARQAYQNNARLIRVLSVFGTPARPEELVASTLIALSEVFIADVTCLVDVVRDTLVVTDSCGLPEEDPAFSGAWHRGPSVERALAGREPLATPADDHDLPPSLRGMGFVWAAWIPLPADPDTDERLLVLFRRRPEPFSPGDLQLLHSVVERMNSVVEAGERAEAIERLAAAGHELAAHLEVGSLLDHAVHLFRTLTGAASAWIITLHTDEGGEADGGTGSDGRTASLGAQIGMPDEFRQWWPRPVSGLQELAAAIDNDHFHDRVSGPPPWIVLAVPVLREGHTTALLCAASHRPGKFSKPTVDVAKIMANHLAVAMRNVELYRALSQRERELRRRATHDPLTGLANRSHAAQRIEEVLTTTPGGRVGLLFCDLDKFKDVNDRMGHDAGDDLLNQVAARLRRATRPGDLLARFGGDEFVFVLAGVASLAEIAEIGQRIKTALDDPFVVRGELVHVSASVGGVLGARGRSTANGLLRDADAAMYAAKGKGPGNVEVFDEAASHRSQSQLDLRSELPRALERGELSVEYQPIMSLTEQRVLGFEALLRWNHPRFGGVAPEETVRLAEELGAIDAIGDWVVREACTQLAAWRRRPHGQALTVWINMTAAQLRSAERATRTLEAIAAAGLTPRDIWIEVTEHARVAESEMGPATTLREAGVRFALDDFGMSYSGLSYLQWFPVDCIKIDRSFVAGVAQQGPERSIVEAILGMARQLGLDVTAEGIETTAQATALVSLGCTQGQGFLLSRPLPPGAAAALLAG